MKRHTHDDSSLTLVLISDLDNRLTKAFASKIAIAIFSALQDTRAGVNKVQTTLDGMATNLEVACRNATREGLQEAIRELKEEAYCARLGGGGGSAGGFRTGEAEKIISSVRKECFLSLIN